MLTLELCCELDYWSGGAARTISAPHMVNSDVERVLCAGP